ncbi:hypothetical protein SteCoe_8252 [Stentor coeruleus]|uniref:Uncharacterized protein n=1 Tax=Stentor coeruleus TaxID=5963 RepID=A0A1R2CKK6_9CILI|nr:hypothetical protein SteCoe_8252 [Stentor coeruleus]
MLERQGHLPGYTGHIAKNPALEEVGPVPVKHSHIPNYQGFIPSVKAENLFGKTYGKITEISSLGTHNKGKDIPPEEKYKSIAQENYTNQLRINVMPFRPKEYPEPPVDPITEIPPETISMFFGQRVPGGMNSTQGFRLSNNLENAKQNNQTTPSETLLSYEEARKLASTS